MASAASSASTPATQGAALAPNAPTRGKLFARGLVRHCPFCGSGHLFHAYFKLKDECPRCRLRFQRLDGQWSGDIGIHTVVTFGLLYVTLMVGVVAFYGHINVVALSVIGGFIVVIFPALFVPFAKTLWLAIDLMMRPAEATEFTPSAERAEAPAEDEA